VDRSWKYINRSQTHESGNWDEATQFPEMEYINGIFVAVRELLEWRGRRGLKTDNFWEMYDRIQIKETAMGLTRELCRSFLV
jgi:hypothetical protein